MNPKPSPALIRSAATAALLLCGASPVPAADESHFLPAPPASEFPAKSVADAGLDSEAFLHALAPLYDGSMTEVHSILVLAGGTLVYEDYFVGNTDRIDFEAGLVRVPGEPRQWKPDDLHYVASVAKTVTALVTGIALQELGWPLDEPIAPHLPGDLLPGDKSRITPFQLLTMTSGIQWDEWTGRSNEYLWSTKERFGHLASLPLAAVPGTRWTYNSGATNLLLLALEGAVEGGCREFADARFFRPLGIDNYRWSAFEGNIPDGGAGLFLRPRDMAKIGLLVLNGGEYNGTRVVPEAFARAAMSPQVSTAPVTAHDYGFMMWIRKLAPDAGAPVEYVAIEGDGGNNINIFPDRGLVVVTTGGHYRDWPAYEPQGQSLLRRIVPLFPVGPATVSEARPEPRPER